MSRERDTVRHGQPAGTESTRRNLLAALGAGMTVGIAGCGYQPGGGELDWDARVDAGGGMIPRSGSRWWFTDGESLVGVHNRRGRTHDFEEREWVTVEDAIVIVYTDAGTVRSNTETERQCGGRPAMNGDGVYVPLDDGSVTAITWGTGESDGWSVERDGAPLALTAGDDIVCGTDGSEVYGFESGSGAERFALELDHGLAEGEHSHAVAGGRMWALADDEQTLVGIDSDGNRIDVDLPARSRWLVPSGEFVIVGIEGEGIEVLDADGQAQATVDHEPNRTVPAVTDDRLYYYADGRLVAVDLPDGEVVWERDRPFVGKPVADETGVYGRRARTDSGGSTSRCELAAVTADGDDWWQARTPADVDCDGTLFLVGDRLVVADDDELYGFRTAPGRRFSVL